MIIVVIVVLILYVFMMLSFMIGWKNIYNESSAYLIRVSVVVAVRNEQDNIQRLVQNLRDQDYDKKMYNVIIVDDHSNDNSWALLCKEKLNWPELLLLSMNSDEHGKKQAILKAVKFSDSEIILTSDADCFFSSDWITAMTSCFLDKKINLVSGPVSFNNEPTIFSKIQTLEFLSLVASGAGAIGINKPIFCNGANMAYRREVFLSVNNYSQNSISSGDDVFLLHMVKKFYPRSIVFLKKHEAIVFTNAITSFKSFINQRIRWTSKSSSYKDPDSILTSLLVFIVNLSLVLLLIFSLYDYIFIYLFLLFFLMKSLVDILFLVPVLRFFKRLELIKWILPLQIAYSFYITLIVIISNFIPFNWKGRLQKK